MSDHDKALEAAARAYVHEAMRQGFHVDQAACESRMAHAITAFLAQREADGPTAAEVDAVARVLRDEGCSGDTYRAARHAIRAMLAARPKGDG